MWAKGGKKRLQHANPDQHSYGNYSQRRNGGTHTPNTHISEFLANSTHTIFSFYPRNFPLAGFISLKKPNGEQLNHTRQG
jgi:hypothetical protein